MGNKFVNCKKCIELSRGGADLPQTSYSGLTTKWGFGRAFKRALLLSFFVILFLTQLSANTSTTEDNTGKVLVSWKNDRNYSFFRWQRDSEDEDGWTKVSGDTLSIELPYHSGLNIYYIQSSWDGISWSESGYDIYIHEEENNSACTCSTLLWTWTNNSIGAEVLRWKLNGDDDNNWTYVLPETSSLVLPAREGENTLHVEASYDGRNWSETATGTYYYTPEVYYPKKYELSISLMPYTLQRIHYSSSHTPESRLSGYSNGVALSFAYNISSRFALAGDISGEYYTFSLFHNYHDFKLDVRARYTLLDSEHYRNKFYVSFGAGFDAVLRDDRKAGCYPLLVLGIEDSFMLSEKLSLSLSCSVNSTFQDGTTVFHLLPSLSFTYHYGCKAGCKGGCR